MKVGLALAALLALAAGCNSVTMVDDVDLTLDFNPLRGPSDLLHQPYVQGSSMTLYVTSTDGKVDETGWSIESSDPNVFAPGQVTPDDHHHNRFSVPCRALSAGQALITVRDRNGHVMHAQPVEVALPDRIELLAHGLLIIGHPDAEADITEARIRAGGTATYLARYWRGPQQLFGNGALSTDEPTGVVAQVAQTFLFEDRDWLQLEAEQTGTMQLALSVGGTHVSDLPVVAVPDSDVSSLRILGMDESHAHKGQWLAALAQAYDGQGRAIYGVDYTWDVNGETQLGYGDLYRYEYNPKDPGMLGAHFSGMDVYAEIHGYGYVDSTNNLGCSAAPGTPPSRAPIWLLTIFLGLLLRDQPLRMSRYIRQLLFAGSSTRTASHSRRASSLRPRE